ncbi:methyltransferase domain-containing protein [candidate division KSB3 bacterium]|nr:methyltransferase domain-containing protein [candidate division KSB3 bacterium]
MKINVCPCCGGKNIRNFIHYRRLPEILFPVDKEIQKEIRYYDLDLNHCLSCHHIFQSHVDLQRNKRIYEKLYKYYPFREVEYFVRTYRLPFEEMFRQMAPRASGQKRLLEVGCSSPEAMCFFVQEGFSCTGVDPTSTDGESRTVSIKKGRYEKIFFDRQFDVVVTRFVLEHIIDLTVFMSKLSRDMKDDGIVFVQVPSTRNFIEGGMLCIGAHEHIHYYSENSLQEVFARFGFVPCGIREAGMQSLLGCFRKETKGAAIDIKSIDSKSYRSFSVKVAAAARSFREKIMPYQNICFYGAGLQLVWILHLSGASFSKKKISIIDDNELFYGRCLPGVGVAIAPPGRDALQAKDVVVLSLNSAYYNAAITKIKKFAPQIQKILAYCSGSWRFVS